MFLKVPKSDVPKSNSKQHHDGINCEESRVEEYDILQGIKHWFIEHGNKDKNVEVANVSNINIYGGNNDPFTIES